MANFKEVLQADAYAGPNALYVDSSIHEATRWVQARIKLCDVHEVRPLAMTTEAPR